MNINYKIPDDLHRALKVTAAREGKTLKQLLIDLLTEALAPLDHEEEYS